MTPDKQNEITSQIVDEEHKNIILYNIKNNSRLYFSDNEKIDKQYVHKTQNENVFISHPIVVYPNKKIYRTQIIAEINHPFFFDHPLEHLPGLLILEASRQFGTAISHLFFNVPFDSQFILHDLGSRFTAGANVVDNVFIDVIITDAKIKNNRLKKMTGIGYVHQNTEIIGEITSSWSIVPLKIMEHLAKFH